MKLIPQTVELLKQEDWKKQIEIAARTCYKSEDKIAEGTADKMLEKLINSKHYAMLEHGTIYLHISVGDTGRTNKLSRFLNKYYNNPYSRARIDYTGSNVYITTNYRVIKEHGWEKDLKYMCNPTDNHVKRYTFRLTTSIGIVRELLRHRVFSFANESTRYCNYSKDKFGGEVTFIKPSWLSDATALQKIEFAQCCQTLEDTYIALLGNWNEKKLDARFRTGFKNNPLTPQQAREVLPLCTKSELVMTGFKDDWDRFLELRLDGVTGKPHPDMLQLASMIKSSLH